MLVDVVAFSAMVEGLVQSTWESAYVEGLDEIFYQAEQNFF